MRTDKIAGLGPVMQMSFIPADVPAALRYWTEIMGVGPFAELAHVQAECILHRGQDVKIDFTIYLAYWGDMQIEIVEQHNDAPSIYKTWRDAGQEGLHHTCILTDDMAASRAALAAAGATILQEIFMAGGGEAIYADTGGGPGTILEVYAPTPDVFGAFEYIKGLGVGWDGTEPVRRLG